MAHWFECIMCLRRPWRMWSGDMYAIKWSNHIHYHIHMSSGVVRVASTCVYIWGITSYIIADLRLLSSSHSFRLSTFIRPVKMWWQLAGLRTPGIAIKQIDAKVIIHFWLVLIAASLRLICSSCYSANAWSPLGKMPIYRQNGNFLATKNGSPNNKSEWNF